VLERKTSAKPLGKEEHEFTQCQKESDRPEGDWKLNLLLKEGPLPNPTEITGKGHGEGDKGIF